jgi:hypothetical protein
MALKITNKNRQKVEVVPRILYPEQQAQFETSGLCINKIGWYFCIWFCVTIIFFI